MQVKRMNWEKIDHVDENTVWAKVCVQHKLKGDHLLRSSPVIVQISLTSKITINNLTDFYLLKLSHRLAKSQELLMFVFL